MDFAVYPFKREKKYRLYVKFTDENGKQRAKSTGISYPHDASQKERKKAQKEAEKKALDILSDHLQTKQRRVDKKNQAPLLSSYLEEYYYPHVRSSCAESTLVSYQGALEHFMRISGDYPMDEYNRSTMSKYKLHRFDKEDIRKTTINIEMRSIKTAFSWAWKNDFLEKMPYKGQDFLFDAKSKKREFKKSEVQRLLKQTEGKMIGLVIRLAYFTGMRIGEMTELTWNDVNVEEKYLNIPGDVTKTGKDRFIPLGDKAFNMVRILENVLRQKMKKAPDFYEDKRKEDCYLLQKQRGHGQYAPLVSNRSFAGV